MAGLDGQLRIAAHEVRGHGDLARSGSTACGSVGEFLDEAEDVIPAAAVQAGGVLAQLVENLVHLEAGQDGFDQHGALMEPLGSPSCFCARKKTSFHRRASRWLSILGR